jgi:pilus assembly protein TadC
MYNYFVRFYPKGLRKSFMQLLQYSNIKISPDRFLGFLLLFSLSIAFVAAFDLYAMYRLNFVLVFIGSFVFVQVLSYVWFLMHIDQKSTFVESVLPDALQLMASNLRAGLTTDRALLLSARPEFGPLKDELNTVGKEIATGKEISVALQEMTKRIKSDAFERTIALIISGMKSGGDLASLLEQTSEYLRNQAIVDKKIRSSVQMYVIFIFSAIAVGAPMLFALSSVLVKIISVNIAAIDIPEEAITAVPLTFGGVSVSSGFILTYTVISLLTSSILGSLVLGLIGKGKEKGGIVYIPVLIFLTLTIFFVTRKILTTMFSGLFGI